MFHVQVSKFIEGFYWSIIYPRWRFWNDEPQIQSLYDTFNNDMILGEAYHGIREKKQDMQRMFTVIPATRLASMYHSGVNSLKLSLDYAKFLS